MKLWAIYGEYLQESCSEQTCKVRRTSWEKTRKRCLFSNNGLRFLARLMDLEVCQNDVWVLCYCCSVGDHTVTPLFRPVRSGYAVVPLVMCEGSCDRQLGRCGSILYAGCVFVIISASIWVPGSQCRECRPFCWPSFTKWKRLSMWRVFRVSLPFLAICTVAALSVINTVGVWDKICECCFHSGVPRYRRS